MPAIKLNPFEGALIHHLGYYRSLFLTGKDPQNIAISFYKGNLAKALNSDLQRAKDWYFSAIFE